MFDSSPPSLPARVRVSRLPLPPAPAVQSRLKTLFAAQPGLPLSQLAAGAVAVAGGKVIGAALSWPGAEGEPQRGLELESGWRGRGIEEALLGLLTADRSLTGQPRMDQPTTDQPTTGQLRTGQLRTGQLRTEQL